MRSRRCFEGNLIFARGIACSLRRAGPRKGNIPHRHPAYLLAMHRKIPDKTKDEYATHPRVLEIR